MLTKPENARVMFDQDGIDHLVDAFGDVWCEDPDASLEGMSETFDESNLCEDCKAALREDQEEELDG